jgi:hypothetical protein
MRCKKALCLTVVACIGVMLLSVAQIASAEPNLAGMDRQALAIATQCRNAVAGRLEQLIKSGKLSQNQLFDTFYIPIPNTYPQKFHTQYDTVLDATIQNILDNYLKTNSHILYVVATDTHGYAPTHNSKYSQPQTGNKEIDAARSRAKIIFTDRTGLAAAKNTSTYLLQEYARDTGEMVYDVSVPLFIRGQRWGCIRVGFSK